jgi:hypothetical protein
MQKKFAGRVQTSHFQFSLFDANVDPGENMPDWAEADFSRRGYITNGQAIGIGTVADLHTPWIEVFLSKAAPNFDDCKRVLAINLAITSEALILTDIMECLSHRINIKNGEYIVYSLAYNLGVEGGDELSDEELEKAKDLERYKIVLVPGRTEHEGVIKGEQYLLGDDSSISYDYLFSLFDERADTDPSGYPNWNEDDYARLGYFTTGKKICIGTRSISPTTNFYTPIVKASLSDVTPNLDNSQRAIAFNLRVTSGVVIVADRYGFLDDRIELENGTYIAYILAYNLGTVPSNDMSDEERDQRTDLERYKIFLVPGSIEHEGVVKGEQYLWDED